MKFNWKEASSVILTAFKKSPVKSTWNYSVLTLKRSSRSSFMPDGCVFPGGSTCLADTSKEWLNIFSKFNINIKCLNAGKIVPPIVLNNVGDIPKLISLKITAIRETFEETGILLCLPNSCSNVETNSFHKIENLELWRSRVQKDGSEFLTLCFENNCCPDINNLHLWSNWLTPTSMGSQRFDTAFFITCVKEQPNARADYKETQKLFWSTPEDLLNMSNNKEIWLPPPQVYEISRLSNFHDFFELQKFAESRSIEGCERWMPIQIQTSDGRMSILPGDDAYELKDFVTPTEPLKVDASNEKFMSQFKVLHRMVFLNKTQTKVVVKNYNPKNGHKLPVTKCKKIIFV